MREVYGKSAPGLCSYGRIGVRCCFLRGFVTGIILFGLAPAWADGCFVFKWNKTIDINEPTQKAILFHDSGREELLLQVKYEGPLESFGWLIPTPSLPEVEEGSMEPFYEVSRLTQQWFSRSAGGTGLGGRTLGTAGAPEAVQVIQVKTVGAYEVSILSSRDAGSLERWLRAHNYSFPEGKTDIVEDYIRRGWFFVAAKIDLDKGRGFKTVSATASKDPQGAAVGRKTLQTELSSGELHPLLLRFETPKAVFPLKISAVGGKPSEVSLYVIGTVPLMNGFIFGKAMEQLGQQYRQWEEKKSDRARQRQRMYEKSDTVRLRSFLNSFYTKGPREPLPDPSFYAKSTREPLRDYTPDDLLALAREEQPRGETDQDLGEVFSAENGDPLQCLPLNGVEQLPGCARTFSRLKAGQYLTKQVYTFMTNEMHDLEFEPALPALARTVPQPAGNISAQALVNLGPSPSPYLLAACSSSNSIERLNAVIGARMGGSWGFGDLLPTLLRDDVPAIRLHAFRLADANPEPRFADTIVELLRDPLLQIRQEASSYLSNREPPERTYFYVYLMKDRDPNVRMSAVSIAACISRYRSSEEVYREALHLLRDPNEQVRASALHALYQMQDKEVPREDLLALLSSPIPGMSTLAQIMLLRPRNPGAREPSPVVSATETMGLLTNRLATARLAGLRNLQQTGGAEAVALILPLLTDTNRLVRHRAFFVLQQITGRNVSENDPAQWQAWWETNKATFR